MLPLNTKHFHNSQKSAKTHNWGLKNITRQRCFSIFHSTISIHSHILSLARSFAVRACIFFICYGDFFQSSLFAPASTAATPFFVHFILSFFFFVPLKFWKAIHLNGSNFPLYVYFHCFICLSILCFSALKSALSCLAAKQENKQQWCAPELFAPCWRCGERSRFAFLSMQFSQTKQFPKWMERKFIDIYIANNHMSIWSTSKWH